MDSILLISLLIVVGIVAGLVKRFGNAQKNFSQEKLLLQALWLNTYRFLLRYPARSPKSIRTCLFPRGNRSYRLYAKFFTFAGTGMPAEIVRYSYNKIFNKIIIRLMQDVGRGVRQLTRRGCVVLLQP